MSTNVSGSAAATSAAGLTPTAGPTPAAGAGRPARRRGRDPEARLARNLERAEDLDYHLLWLRTTDTRILRQMLYPFDRACQRIRAMMGGLQVPLAEGREALDAAARLVEQATALVPPVSAGSDGLGPTPDALPVNQKAALRAWRRAIAGEFGVDFYLPRSPEGARLTEVLPRLDAKLLQARNAATSLEEADQLLVQTAGLIRECHETVTRLAALAGVDYEPPRQLKPRAGRVWGAGEPLLPPAGEPPTMSDPADSSGGSDANPESADRAAEDRPRGRRVRAV